AITPAKKAPVKALSYTCREPPLTVPQHGGQHTRSAGLKQQRFGEVQRAARIENVVDDDDVAPPDVAADIAHHAHLSPRDALAIIARKVDEIDLGLESFAVERPDEIGGKDETALLNRDHRRV